MDDANPPPTPLPSRSDLALYAQALRQDWPIPAKVKQRILQLAVNLVEPDDDEPPAAPAGDDDESDDDSPPAQHPGWRRQARAMEILASFGRLNIQQQRLDLMRAEHERRAAEAREKRGAGDGSTPKPRIIIPGAPVDE